MVIGTLGNGKSTVLNTLIGGNQGETFETSKKPRGCTQEASSAQTQWENYNITLTDTPGLFDLKMPLPMWLAKYGSMPNNQKSITKILWVIRSCVRPDEQHRLTRDIIEDMFENPADF